MFKLQVSRFEELVVNVTWTRPEGEWNTLMRMLEAIPESQVHLNSMFLPERVSEIKRLTLLSIEALGMEDPEDMPESIGTLLELRTLGWSFSRLKTLPRALSSLRQLTRLSLSYNNLCTLPDDLWNLDQLTHLHLNSNKIVSIPDSYVAFSTLEIVNLFENALEEIPWQFVNCKSLSINFQKNPCMRLINGPFVSKDWFDYAAPLHLERHNTVALINNILPQPIAEEIVPYIRLNEDSDDEWTCESDLSNSDLSDPNHYIWSKRQTSKRQRLSEHN